MKSDSTQKVLVTGSAVVRFEVLMTYLPIFDVDRVTKSVGLVKQ